MSKSNRNTPAGFFEALRGFFRRGRKPAAKPVALPDDPAEALQVTVNKVLVIVYNPVMEAATGRRLIDFQGWRQPEDLATGFMGDILQASHGLARYQVVERYDLDEFPAKEDGFRYTPQTLLDVLRGAVPFYQPQSVDYRAIMKEFDVLQRVARKEIDEVWLFGFPHAGFYESIMAGKGAFWCNAPPLKRTDAARRRFVIMGFNYERGVGEMLEAFGHRVESILDRVFENLRGEANLWRRFTGYEKSAPGRSALGNVHFAPNSERDYDWNNPKSVRSECDDWLLNFPTFKGVVRNVTSADWGHGDIRAHHRWWLKHLPHVAGRQNGISNNWWKYVMAPETVGRD